MQHNQQTPRLINNNLPATIEDTGSILNYLINPETHREQLIAINRAVNFDVCVNPGGEPSLRTACLIDNRATLKAIYLITFQFINENFPDSQTETTAETFARDVVEINATWNAHDVVYFFKWVRQNQTRPELKIYGNKINALALINWCGFYNEARAEAHELSLKAENEVKNKAQTAPPGTGRALAELKQRFKAGEITEAERRHQYNILLNWETPAAPNPLAEKIKEFAEQLAARVEVKQKAAEIENQTRREKTVIYHKENAAKYLELNKQIEAGQITAAAADVIYNNFLIREQ